DLGNADLSGNLVPQLGLLKNLQYLFMKMKCIHDRLNDNNLSGQIPVSLTTITTLQVL
ncbi:hypothetical protein BHE74_00054039, partial [Ensete ventricosum]